MSDSQKKWVKKIIFLSSAFLIPALFFINVFLTTGITQGNYTILTSDLNGQYVSYFLHFRDAVLNGKGLLYTYSLPLGGDTFSLLGYYMINPLNLLVLIFPVDKITSAIYLIITIKVGLIGLFGYLFFSRKHKFSAWPLFFSSVYALSGYVFSFFMNLMWLDSLYLLPLVALGLEELVRKKRSWIYVISLALAIIFCYYTGYMLAGFSFLYIIYLCICNKYGWRNGFFAWLRYLLASDLAVGLSVCTLLPTLLSQMGNRSSVAVTPENHSYLFFTKFFTASCSIEDFNMGLPQIYCGTFILLLCIIYFYTGTIKIRRKIGAFFLLSAFFLSFSITRLDMVWHGFTYPNGFLHRYSFILVFVMVMLAEEVFMQERAISIAPVIFASVTILIMGAGALWLGGTQERLMWLIADAVVLLTFSVLFYLAKRSKGQEKYTLYIVLVFVQLVQLFANAGCYVRIHRYDDHSCMGYYKKLAPVIKNVKRLDTDFCRIEKVFYNSLNDPMMLSYNGISHFSSASKTSVREFLEKIGYTKRLDLWISYSQGATLAGDAFLGVKYVLSEGKALPCYERREKYENIIVNRNPYALPIGILSEASACGEIAVHEKNPFLNQQELYNAVCNTDTKLFSEYEDIELTLENLQSENTYYTKKTDGDGVIWLQLTAKDENPIYMYLPAEYYPGLEVSVNKIAIGDYLTIENHGILPLGSFRAGDKVVVGLKLHEGYTQFEEPLIYSLDLEKLSEITSGLQGTGWSVSSYSNTKILATAAALDDNRLLLMTIPFDENWRVIVDGQEVEPKKALGLFMAVPLSKGTHTISLSYHAAGLWQGMLISLFAAIFCALLFWLEWRRRDKKEPKENKEDFDGSAPTVNYNKEESFLLTEYKNSCQMCREDVGEKGAEFLSLFAEVVSEEDNLRFTGWNRLCLCESCANKIRVGKTKMPGFVDWIKHERTDIEQAHKFKVLIDEAEEISGELMYTSRHLQNVQKAVYLYQWLDGIEAHFRF